MSVPGKVVQVVRRVFGVNARLVGVDLPGAWDVARLHLAGTGGQKTVVAKWLRSNPQRWRTDPRQMTTEVAGLRFADELAPGMVPKVIAAEVDQDTGGVILLEDLAPRQPLDALIRREGVAATADARPSPEQWVSWPLQVWDATWTLGGASAAARPMIPSGPGCVCSAHPGSNNG